MSKSHLVISLDFELMWGVRDHSTVATYGANVLGVRQAIPGMLALFHEFGIRATWATVGFLLCESKEEMVAMAPDDRPQYDQSALSNYSYLDEVGEDEARDPYYFGLRLVRQIQDCPGQEIGSHTYSHFYCLEPGPTSEQFAADVKANIEVAHRRGLRLVSIVFPRNQYAHEHLRICAEHQVSVFRGNEDSPFHRPAAQAGRSWFRRPVRLIDNYINVAGWHVASPTEVAGMINIPSSRFLRPHNSRLAPLDRLRLARIISAMTAAAMQGKVYHLWWHPHNFGRNTAANLHFLRMILMCYRQLHDEHGMLSSCMGDFTGNSTGGNVAW